MFCPTRYYLDGFRPDNTPICDINDKLKKCAIIPVFIVFKLKKSIEHIMPATMAGSEIAMHHKIVIGNLR